MFAVISSRFSFPLLILRYLTMDTESVKAGVVQVAIVGVNAQFHDLERTRIGCLIKKRKHFKNIVDEIIILPFESYLDWKSLQRFSRTVVAVLAKLNSSRIRFSRQALQTK